MRNSTTHVDSNEVPILCVFNGVGVKIVRGAPCNCLAVVLFTFKTYAMYDITVFNIL